MDYKKLTEDLQQARLIAEEAAKGEDGGTTNLDFFVLRIKGSQENNVLEAIRQAGCFCRGESNCSCYFISFICGGDANSRIRAVSAARRYMHKKGYNVSSFYRSPKGFYESCRG